MKRVSILKKQNSKWEITTTHLFTHRHYQVDEIGNFYRNGKIKEVKPDKKGNLVFLLIDDNYIKLRFKVHQIILQTFDPYGIKNGLSCDHIDRARLNNNINNLRFANRKTQFNNRENTIYKLKKVYCENTNIIYSSCQEAEIKLKLVKNTVARVARGNRKSIHGYKFSFVP